MKDSFFLKNEKGERIELFWNNNQKHYFNILNSNKNIMYYKNEKCGETTMSAFYLLLNAMKNPRTKIQIKAHKAGYANYLFKLMRAIYFNNKNILPNTKIVDCEINNARKEIIFDNGSKISYIRFFKRLLGKPVSILYVCDFSKFERGREVPFFEKNILKSLVEDKNIKIILVKTKPKTPRRCNKNDFFDRIWRKHKRKELNIFYTLEDVY